MILRTENLTYTVYEKRIFSKAAEIKILNNINLSVKRGDIFGITGESGSGKTTLAKIIAGIIKPTSGKIYFNPSDGSKRRISPVQMLFQNNGEIVNPFRRVKDVISETLEIRYGNTSVTDFEQIINYTGINKELLQRRGLELSGGEQQRFALARVLAASPELLILDEPFSAQDPGSQQNLISLFKKINKEFNITLICISHFTGTLKNLSTSLAVMFDGKIVEQGKTEDIFNSPHHSYTKFLLSAASYKLSKKDLLDQRKLILH